MVCHHRLGCFAAALAGIAFDQSPQIGRTRLDRSANIQLATAAKSLDCETQITCCTPNRRRPKWNEQNESMPYFMSVLKTPIPSVIADKRSGFRAVLKTLTRYAIRDKKIFSLSCLTGWCTTIGSVGVSEG